LWYSGLLRVAESIRGDDPRRSQELRLMAEHAGRSFAGQFWNAELECCHDVLTPPPPDRGGTWKPISQVRPNQVFAVSLPHSPLTGEQQRGVLRIVRERLLTPHGLRTLDPADPAYKGRFRGTMFERDGAYHNGTVWPWLIGPYAEAVLRAGSFSPESREEALAALEPIILSLEDGALGHVPEVYDGDATVAEPQLAGGCIAQAWSVAEVVRVLMMMAG
jgi:glycogen debranching enzyme